jgi:pimeloyl-ACP methyl ester carboxylesterase
MPDHTGGGRVPAGRLGWADLRLALSAPRPHGLFRSHRISVRGVPTHYRAATATGGMPVVLLHGLAVSHRYLMPTARALAPHHPVYVPDLPGFGLSGKPPHVYGPSEHAAHIAAFIDLVATGSVCVLGNSFGCEIAARLAARHPHSVRALVLIGPTSDPAARSYRGQVQRWLVDLLREDPRQAVILGRDVCDAGLRRIAATLRTSVHNAIERDLAASSAPTLLLRGSRDPVAPAGWLIRAARACGGHAEIAGIPASAHNAVTTGATLVAERVERFLAQPLPAPARP